MGYKNESKYTIPWRYLSAEESAAVDAAEELKGEWYQIHDFLRGFGYRCGSKVVFVSDLSLLNVSIPWSEWRYEGISNERLQELYTQLQPIIEERRAKQIAEYETLKAKGFGDFNKISLPNIKMAKIMSEPVKCCKRPIDYEPLFYDYETIPEHEVNTMKTYGDDDCCTAVGTFPPKESNWAKFPNFPKPGDQLGLHLLRMLNLHVDMLIDRDKQEIIEVLERAAQRGS